MGKLTRHWIGTVVGIGLAFACSAGSCLDDRPAERPELRDLRFEPACGRPGDQVRITFTSDDPECRETVGFHEGVDAKLNGAAAYDPVSKQCALTVTVPEGAVTGRVWGRSAVFGPHSKDDFEIPCGPDAGGPDAEAGTPGEGSGTATAIPFEKIGTATSRSFGIAANGHRLFSIQTGDSQVFDVDPAVPGSAKRSKFATTNITSLLALADGSTILSGKAPLGPWIGKLDGAGDVAWASRFGLDGDYPKQIALLDATHVATPIGNGFRVAETDVSVAGGKTTIRTFDAGPQGEIWGAEHVVPFGTGGYVVGGVISVEEFVVHDLLLIAVDAGRNITWQKRFNTGGNNLLSFVIPLTDGGLLVGGALGSPGTGAQNRQSWVARLSPTGGVVWQRTYGTEWMFANAAQTPSGFALLGSPGTGIVVTLMDGDGNITLARRFEDSSAAGDEGSAGIAVVNPSTLVFNGVAVMTHSFYSFETGLDLKLGGCADPKVGVDIPTSSITTGTPTVTITDSTFTSTVADATNTALTLTVTKDTVTTANVCTN